MITNRFQENLEDAIRNGQLGRFERQSLRQQANAFYEGAASSHKELQLLKEQLKAIQKELTGIKRELVKLEKEWMLKILKEQNNNSL